MPDSGNPTLSPDALEAASLRLIEDLGAGMLATSCRYPNDSWSRYETLAAIGCDAFFEIPCGQVTSERLEEASDFIRKNHGWLFFHLGYDLKNGIEALTSENPDRIEFPEMLIFRPKAVAGIREGVFFSVGDPAVLQALQREIDEPPVREANAISPPVQITKAISRMQYLEAIGHIRDHIQRGDIYEMNFCQEFFGEIDATFNPALFWKKLIKIAPAPFAAYYRWGTHFLASASPERFLQKRELRLISQPMKGTTRRGSTPAEDEDLKKSLLENEKERAENVMIVDLVRNDLSRIAQNGSVKVPELFGIYTFPGVHQMISTVCADMAENTTFTDILRAAFPMGSMTGAPKIRAMQLIEQYEYSKRGLFSGSVGYMNPEGDMDMSVIIRSVTGNLSRNIISFQTGGAITADSDPEAEYEETILKAGGIMEALGSNSLNLQ